MTGRLPGSQSRTLNDANENYNISQKECLAVVSSVLVVCPYVELGRFIVRTNHQSWKWIPDLKESTGPLARRRLRLMEFDFRVQHQPEWKHIAADALSRFPTDQTDNSDLDVDLPAYAAAKCNRDKQKPLTI